MRINIDASELIYPYFVAESFGRKQAIKDFPGVYRLSLSELLRDVEALAPLGLNKILLFGVPKDKSASGDSAYATDSLVARAVRMIKKRFPGIIVFTDVCLCAYMTHGHCGIIQSQVASHKTQVQIDNKKTLDALAKMAVAHAQAGADWVAPSAMAKREVFAVRRALDENGFQKTRILGYSAKFASSFYGPFRNAADSSPKMGDRSGYQLEPADLEAALEEARLDADEGADMVMVKPALAYLDVVRQVKQEVSLPVAAYNVSGEYAFVKYGAARNLWEEKAIVREILTSIKRAGADLIITYHAKDAARWLRGQECPRV